MEFLFFWRHVTGKPVVASWNVACFLKLSFTKTLLLHFRPVNRGIMYPRNGWPSSSLAWSQVILISWAFYSRTATNGHLPIIGWFSNGTGTSVDDGARKSNNWLDQWQSDKLGTGSRVSSFLRAFPSLNNVRVLLLNQPNDHLSAKATVFVGESIHWLLFKHLYIGHFLLSPRCPLRRGSTV